MQGCTTTSSGKQADGQEYRGAYTEPVLCAVYRTFIRTERLRRRPVCLRRGGHICAPSCVGLGAALWAFSFSDIMWGVVDAVGGNLLIFFFCDVSCCFENMKNSWRFQSYF